MAPPVAPSAMDQDTRASALPVTVAANGWRPPVRICAVLGEMATATATDARRTVTVALAVRLGSARLLAWT